MMYNKQIQNEELFKDYPDVITIADLQSMLHIGRNAAYKLLQDKCIHSMRYGRKYIIPKSSVTNFIMEGIENEVSLLPS